MNRPRWTIQDLNLKGWEPFLLPAPLVVPVITLNPLAALMYVLGGLVGICTLAWMLKNRPDLISKRWRSY